LTRRAEEHAGLYERLRCKTRTQLQGQEAWTFVTGRMAEDGIEDKAENGMVAGRA